MKRALGLWLGVITLCSACDSGTPGGPSSSTGGAADGSSGGGPGTIGSGGAVSGAGGTSGGSLNGTGGALSGAGGSATGGTASGGAGSGETGGAPGSGGQGQSSTGSPNPLLVPLSVDGKNLTDPSGKTIVLRGTSLIDIGTLYANGGKTIDAITTRMDKIEAAGLSGHTVRLPVYPKITYNGGYPYCSPQPYPVGTGPGTTCQPSTSSMTGAEYIAQILKPTVDAATDRNLYVIIDFHQIDDVTQGTSAADAETFWHDIAPVFADYTNVLYEAFNEPIDSGSKWSAMKPKAQAWIDTIRAAAPNNIIIVPSPQWAQHPGDAATDPPTGTNLMFTAHVYPGNWNAGFQTQVTTAAAVAPLFFTEWGYDQGSADGTTGTSDPSWGADFRTVVDQSGGSWTAWVTDGSWTPKMFSDMTLSTLSPFGTLTKTWLEETAEDDWVE